MGGNPVDYKYDKTKDLIKWMGAKPKDFIPMLDQMFRSWVGALPKPKQNKKR